MNAKIKISGNIISELSDKIPSNIIAINELIKNSYDAGATKVMIGLDTVNKLLTIVDDGCGMDETDISKLFHISKSEKKYGEMNQYHRRTQGSKGLGFLSVFKFGGQVTWTTRKSDRGFCFSANLSDIVRTEDISEYLIEVIENTELKKGTSIEIAIDDYNLKTLVEYFSDDKNNQKIVNSFIDPTFIIELEVDNKKYSNEVAMNISKQLPERQILYVTYDNGTGNIMFYHKGLLVKTEPFAKPLLPYEINMEIVIFSFVANDKSKISKLFFGPSDALTPLLYVNSNIFNNYTLFDPNIMQTVKRGYVLAQMIGFIKINSESNMMNFNSDRTQFLQNQLTDEIVVFLREINKKIQETGAKIKKQVEDHNYLKVSSLPFTKRNATVVELQNLIRDNYEFKSQVSIHKKNDKIEFSIFGRTISIPILPEEKPTSPPTGGNSSGGGGTPPLGGNSSGGGSSVPAFIKLKQQIKRIPVNSAQIDLIQEIDVAKDSKKQNIPVSSIVVKMDGVILTPPILNSIPTEKMIKMEFMYTDPTTGLVSAMLMVEVYQPKAKMDAITGSDNLFMLPANQGYTLHIDNTIANLFNQLNTLSVDHYVEVIACCVRPLFEISIDCLQKSGKFPSLSLSGDNLAGIVKIIDFISKRPFITAIDRNTGIGFHTLTNILTVRNYSGLVDDANLGAHKSTMIITETQVKDLIYKLKFFLIVVNEMLTNSDIN